MKKQLLFISVLIMFGLNANAQTCAAGGCTSAAETNQYPSSTFSTTSSSWTTVSAYMNGGNWTLFSVTSGDIYEWTYCDNFGGTQGWDPELTLFNNSTSATLCYANNCGLTGCTNAPYIRWTATFTGIVKLLTTVSGCLTNTSTPYSTLVWRDASGAANTPMLGIDVSSYQGTINWSQVAGANYKFAWAKSTEGVTVTDADFVNNIVNGEAAGVKMGAYHFAHPENNSAASEAAHFLNVAQTYITSCQLPPCLDFETTGSLTSAQLTAWAEAWSVAVKNATGITPIIYTSGSIASSLQSSINIYPLWMADPDGSSTAPPPTLGPWAPNWDFKQYSWTGTIPGISGSSVDVDVFNGNSTSFNTFIGCAANVPPVAAFTASTAKCEGQAITLSDNSTNAPTSWTWTMPSGTPASSTSQNPTVTYSTAGTYTVTLVAHNTSGASAPVSNTITVNANPPVPTISLSGNVLTSSASTGNQWYFNGVAVAGAINQIHYVTGNGSYTVETTNSFGCSAMSLPYVLTTTGIGQNSDNTSFAVYPNPANSLVTISYADNSRNILIEIMNDLGERVYTENSIDAGSSFSKTIDMSAFKQGIYLFRIKADETVYSKKVLLIK